LIAINERFLHRRLRSAVPAAPCVRLLAPAQHFAVVALRDRQPADNGTHRCLARNFHRSERYPPLPCIGFSSIGTVPTVALHEIFVDRNGTHRCLVHKNGRRRTVGTVACDKKWKQRNGTPRCPYSNLHHTPTVPTVACDAFRCLERWVPLPERHRGLRLTRRMRMWGTRARFCASVRAMARSGATRWHSVRGRDTKARNAEHCVASSRLRADTQRITGEDAGSATKASRPCRPTGPGREWWIRVEGRDGGV